MSEKVINDEMNGAKKELVDWYTGSDASDFDRDYSVKYAKWSKEKLVKNKFIRQDSASEFVQRKRKYIYWCSLGMNVGSEISEDHFVVVLKEFGSTAVVVPLSSVKDDNLKKEEDGYFNIGEINDLPIKKCENYAVIGQIKTVSKKRLSSYRVGKGRDKRFLTIVLSDEQMDKIDVAVQSLFIK